MATNNIAEQAPSKKTVETLVNPQTLPEAGFQSYEKLKNNASELKAGFLKREFRNPDFYYPGLHDLSDMDRGILQLHAAAQEIIAIEPDEEKANIVAFSLEFRAAEMEYIKLLGRLDFAVHEGLSEQAVRELAEAARSLGEQLYGVPDQKIADAAMAEVWSQLDQKDLSPSAQTLYDELKSGFEWEEQEVAPLPRPDTADQLPDFDDSSLAWAGEIIIEMHAEFEAYFEAYWAEKVAEFGPEYVARPEDIVEAYEGAFRLLDPNSESDVGVVLDPEATALSWESPLMSIKVGGKRAPITSSQELLKKFIHEGGHGRRAINGLKTSMPVLGTGLFTNTTRPDYLTFEEGFLTTAEEAVGDATPKWNGVNLGHYINITLAQNGSDFRATFETAWRYRLLMKLKDGEEVTDEMLRKEQSAAYTAVVRIYRGTPTGLSEAYPDIAPLTFNKDLAYLNGRVLAMSHIKELHANSDTQGLVELFDAKYDPTIPEQTAIARQYRAA